MKLVVDDQAAATRPLAPPVSSRPLGSVVLAAQVVVAAPVTVTVAEAGILLPAPTTSWP